MDGWQAAWSRRIGKCSRSRESIRCLGCPKPHSGQGPCLTVCPLGGPEIAVGREPLIEPWSAIEKPPEAS
jgi:hypothetical protein